MSTLMSLGADFLDDVEGVTAVIGEFVGCPQPHASEPWRGCWAVKLCCLAERTCWAAMLCAAALHKPPLTQAPTSPPTHSCLCCHRGDGDALA